MLIRVRFLLCPLLLTGTIAFQSCQDSLSEDERRNIATAYAEMLLVRNMVSGDSATVLRAIDSTLQKYGFKNEAQLQEQLDLVAMNPDQMREVLDSTQHILERVQRHEEKPDTLGKAKPN